MGTRTPTAGRCTPVAAIGLSRVIAHPAVGIIICLKLPGDSAGRCRHGRSARWDRPHRRRLRPNDDEPGRRAVALIWDRRIRCLRARGLRRQTSTCSSAPVDTIGVQRLLGPIPTSALSLRPLGEGTDGRITPANEVDADLTDDGWTHLRRSRTPPLARQDSQALAIAVMERRGTRLRDHGGAPPPRRRTGERPRNRGDPQPHHYRYLCKRPCFTTVLRRVPTRPT